MATMALLPPAMAAPAAVMPQISRLTAEPPPVIMSLRDMAGGRSQNAR